MPGGAFNNANEQVQSVYGDNLLQLKTSSDISNMRSVAGNNDNAVVGGVTTRIDEKGNLVPGVPNATFVDEKYANSPSQGTFKRTITDEAGHQMGTSHDAKDAFGNNRKLGRLESGNSNTPNNQDVKNMFQSGVLKRVDPPKDENK